MSRSPLKRNRPYVVQVFRPRLDGHERGHIPDAECYGAWVDGLRFTTTERAYGNCQEITKPRSNHIKARVMVDDGKGKVHVCKES